MKKFKKIFVMCMAFFMLFSCNVYAKESTSDIRGIVFEDGLAIPLNEEQMNFYKKNMMKPKEMKTDDYEIEPLRRNTGFWSIFEKKSEYTQLYPSKSVIVTPALKGPGSISYGASVTISAEVSTNVTLSRRAAIGGVWTAENSESFNMTIPVPAGKTMCVKFTPKMRVRKGTITDYVDAMEVGRENITVAQPYKVGKFCNGTYELVPAE